MIQDVVPVLRYCITSLPRVQEAKVAVSITCWPRFVKTYMALLFNLVESLLQSRQFGQDGTFPFNLFELCALQLLVFGPSIFQILDCFQLQKESYRQ